MITPDSYNKVRRNRALRFINQNFVWFKKLFIFLRFKCTTPIIKKLLLNILYFIFNIFFNIHKTVTKQ